MFHPYPWMGPPLGVELSTRDAAQTVEDLTPVMSVSTWWFVLVPFFLLSDLFGFFPFTGSYCFLSIGRRTVCGEFPSPFLPFYISYYCLFDSSRPFILYRFREASLSYFLLFSIRIWLASVSRSANHLALWYVSPGSNL